MGWVPDERRSYRGLFLALALALAAATAWAIADETWVRRPWKTWQREWMARTGEHGPVRVRQIHVPSIGLLDRCTSCHLGVDDPRGDDPDLPRVLRSHPRREELLGTHPPGRFGCTSCHLGQGPALTAASAHGGGGWPEPMFPLEDVEAGCLRCHGQEQELAGAPALSEGRRLFTEKGCGGCHLAGESRPPRRGPSLVHVGSKMYPGALAAYIADPRPRRRGYEMPRFWPGDPDRARQESTAIAAWLLSASLPFVPAEAAGAPDPDLARRGRALFDRVGCRGCHVLGGPGQDEVEIGGESGPSPDEAWAAFGGDFGEDRARAAPPPIDFAPALGAIGARDRPGFLVGWLQDPRSYDPAALMPSFRLDRARALALASFLQAGSPEPPPAPPELLDPSPELLERGRELVSRYGCAGCHEIPGFQDAAPPGPDLLDIGRKRLREMSFGGLDIPVEDRTWSSYVEARMRTPRAFATPDIPQVMPDCRLSDDQVSSLRVYLRGLRGQPAPPGYEPRPGGAEAALGERILRRRNCTGCHSISGREADVLRYYADASMAPPTLAPEGERVRPGWLFNYLLDPRPLRPWLEIVMPSFGLGEDEAAALAAFFAASSGASAPYRRVDRPPVSAARSALGARLFRELKCVTCHSFAAGETDLARLAPDLGLARERLDPAWVARFLADPARYLPGTRMPQFFAGGRSPFPDVLGGDAGAQIDLLVDHLFNLGLQPASAASPPEGT